MKHIVALAGCTCLILFCGSRTYKMLNSPEIDQHFLRVVQGDYIWHTKDSMIRYADSSIQFRQLYNNRETRVYGNFYIERFDPKEAVR